VFPASPKPVVLSGVQPTGDLHLGNYIGALRPWVKGQNQYENYFCIVDLHAFTVPESLVGTRLRDKTREVAALYLAAGIDAEAAVIFAQSDVPEHTELMWLLNCVTPLGWLERMTQFKAKAERRTTVGSGILTYPVLMAADILLYRADLVPVGDDQKQHIELTRDVATRFNAMFGEVFKVPEPRIPMAGARVMALDAPDEKMSKSSGDRSNHAIRLLDSPQVIRRKFARAKTDTLPAVDPENLSAGVRNLIEIHAALNDASTDSTLELFAGKQYGQLKSAVADAVIAELTPLQSRYAEFSKDWTEIDELLAAGADVAGKRAASLVADVRRAIGLS
jgi:tryptophanyl-tRNA synthetase